MAKKSNGGSFIISLFIFGIIVYGLVQFWYIIIPVCILFGIVLFWGRHIAKKSATDDISKNDIYDISSNDNTTPKNNSIDAVRYAALGREAEILKDSLKIIAQSDNVETVLLRYNIALEKIETLSKYTVYELSRIDISPEKLIQSKNELIHSKIDIFNKAILRSYKKQILKVSSFKSDKNKIKNITKFIADIKKLSLPNDAKIYSDELLNKFLKEHSINNTKPKDFVLCNTDLVAVRNEPCILTVYTVFRKPKQFNIPNEILELLWFADGKLKNFSFKKSTTTHNLGNGFNFNVCITTENEPSLIYTRQRIGEILASGKSKLSYFPTYTGLTYNEKATYLNWLQDITQTIDIGYVFIFFYGLERYLYLTEKFEQAFNMILKLRQYHKNSSFNTYSINSLIGSCIVHNRIDLLKNLILNEKTPLTILTLACMAVINLPLTSKQLIDISSHVGFTNKRYIKMEYDLFNDCLTKKFQEHFSSDTFPLSNNYLKETEKISLRISANVSLSECEIEIPNIFTNTDFQNTSFSLLQEAHNDVKEILKERRKAERNKSKQ